MNSQPQDLFNAPVQQRQVLVQQRQPNIRGVEYLEECQYLQFQTFLIMMNLSLKELRKKKKKLKFKFKSKLKDL